jgi:hypothetical protein
MSAKLFDMSGFEDEIYRSMEKTLVNNQVENTHGLQKLAKAVDLLNTAAEIFDQAGMLDESRHITEILQSLTEDVK